ncbi:hypothetical protein WMY93_024411 [Mugilogobius chulae]|uniref:Uncharacterized protein n=1 Tax=Mugilogobius chulae TaxID=88201 RepID=A0AAW0MZL3_9GOBI
MMPPRHPGAPNGMYPGPPPAQPEAVPVAPVGPPAPPVDEWWEAVGMTVNISLVVVAEQISDGHCRWVFDTLFCDFRLILELNVSLTHAQRGSSLPSLLSC